MGEGRTCIWREDFYCKVTEIFSLVCEPNQSQAMYMYMCVNTMCDVIFNGILCGQGGARTKRNLTERVNV